MGKIFHGVVVCMAAFALARMCAGIAQAAGASDVTTIAGSGAAGLADGPAQKATFLSPSGVAIARDGSVYISDSAAQRIRVLTPNGQVRTVAGSGAIVAPGLIVSPGYRDGPAMRAQFSSPMGLAVDRNGAVYIADSNNACIRKLWAGTVSTAVGKCGDSRAVDGDAAAARLVHPEAIAFDRSGNMYIADNGGGLRRLSVDGILTSIHLKVRSLLATGVTISYDDDPTIFIAMQDRLVTYRPSTGEEWSRDSSLPGEDGTAPFGRPNQVVAIDRRQFLFSDLMSANIAYARLPASPFVGNLFAHVIAGGLSVRGTDNAGFANGQRFGARFYNPMALAIVGNRVIVADAGNRRIRAVVLPNLRVSETGFDPSNHFDSDHYEVALIGASWTYWDSLGDDSICAHIEAVLNASKRFRKPVRCHTVRMDAARSTVTEAYIRNVFQYVHVDLIIMASREFSSPDDQAFRLDIQRLLGFLSPLKTRLALVSLYSPFDISNSESIVTDFGSYRPNPDASAYKRAARAHSALRGLPVLWYEAYRDLIKYELTRGAAPLFYPDSGHPNPRGNAFLGEHFAKGLLDAGLKGP